MSNVNSEVVRKNILAIRDHSNETRKGLRDAEAEVQALRNMVMTLQQQLQQQQQQLAILQTKVLGGGTTTWQ